MSVLTTQPLDRLLDYKAPEGGCFLGAFVEVPLGPRKVLGVIWGPGKGDWDYAKTRSVIRVLDAPPMREEMVAFLEKAGAYTLTPMSAMLRLATRSPGLGDPPSMRKIYRMGTGEVDRMTPAREKVLSVLEEFGGLAFTLKELAEMAGVGTSVVKGLVAQGAVAEEQSPRDLPFAPLDPSLPSKELTDDQAAAVAVLNEGQGYSTTLLKGVTGSGKTEVYLEAVAACLRAGRQALVLLPEIALTSEFLTRVEARFGALYDAFRYGCPPHGGIAPGIDRIVMLLADEENIREVTLFPMNQQAQDLMMGAPGEVSGQQLRELGIRPAQPS